MKTTASLSIGFLLLGLTCLPGTAGAAATIDDPNNGGSSSFSWEEPGFLTRIDDLGIDDGVSNEFGSTEWFIELVAPGLITITVGSVYNRPPTYFDLIIDGLVRAWTSFQITEQVISYDEEGNPIENIHYFDGTLVGALLAAGSHTFTLVPDAFNSDGSAGIIEFSGVTSVVPLPPAALLFASAILLLVRRATRPDRMPGAS